MPSTTYQVTLGERVVRVELRTDGEQLLARVDGGQEQPVELETIRGALRSLVVGGRRTDVLAQAQEQSVRLTIDGLEYEAEVLDELRARLSQVSGSRAAAHARRELKAPMPGLVVRVLCTVGEEVEASQPLVVLQAMKMENELSLPRGGTVTAVSTEAGQTVEQGQVLVVVE
jgi:biotin carboxyl carrier protein